MTNVAIITKRIPYNKNYFFIVPSIASGKTDRYTVYKIPSSSSGGIKKIGEELPLNTAKTFIKDYQN